jgi:DNA-binding MarR family transcriptional regulator
MTPGKRPDRNTPVLIHLTAQERELLLAHANPPDTFDDFLPASPPSGQLVVLEFPQDQLDEFLQLVEQTANCAQSIGDGERLGQTYLRLERGLTGTEDPGAHLLRPAASRLGYPVKQGQYLAFAHFYKQLHRRSPAEADFQTYFGVSPPTVHSMLKTLEQRRFIARQKGEARSLRLLIQPHEIPGLE